MFSTPANSILTILVIVALVLIVPDLVRWALIQAVWYSPDGTACRAPEAGACWALIPEKYRLIFFATYPYEEQWRAAIASILIIGITAISGIRRLWSPQLVSAWLAVIALAAALLYGGIFGLPVVGTNLWGGLPLTLLLFVGTVLGGLPLAIFLALGRTSGLPGIKAICTAVIEITRGVPLVTVLFMASLMLPLFLPDGLTVNKLMRAQLGMIVFFAAYAAEVVRGGLQAIPRGQYEAADSLNLGYWKRTGKIVLPQVFRIILPALMNDVIRAFKNTTFVSIIGIYDILGATKAATNDPIWVRYSTEGYLFIFALYFVICFSMSKYSVGIERRLAMRRD
ncbi:MULTISPECIES: amino acid ABC transporter permease [unclassified Aurantimonas]|uniref:amino acid ABC transporter permease n=1 Tax=unclassified Aurantimonas TaxID=2638230 RepID=UPI002E198ABA|nr:MULTISPECIES: amino acid ABC transporter permease [unclassified Aurantimonas]MEC5292800.1 amino acid ABC transporter permease [Aurantimonas sp. C2-3-R2]MEC5413852.1 amino acid ABC transporter permease [Aurantimonas sp. C2-4-R8]